MSDSPVTVIASVVREYTKKETAALRERVETESENSKRMRTEIAELRAENVNLARELTSYVKNDAKDAAVLRKEIETLQAELQQLRELPGETFRKVFRGPYQDDAVYRFGECCQRAGSLWTCDVAETCHVPPGKDGTWLLIVKHGKNGRDGKDAAPEPRAPARPTLTLRSHREKEADHAAA